MKIGSVRPIDASSSCLDKRNERKDCRLSPDELSLASVCKVRTQDPEISHPNDFFTWKAWRWREKTHAPSPSTSGKTHERPSVIQTRNEEVSRPSYKITKRKREQSIECWKVDRVLANQPLSSTASRPVKWFRESVGASVRLGPKTLRSHIQTISWENSLSLETFSRNSSCSWR